MKELICIVCPKGCHLQVDPENDYRVTGNACQRGEAYGKEELRNPTRTLTSTVRVEGGLYPRCPVKTSGPIPRGLLFDAMKALEEVTLTAPVRSGQVVVENICGTGFDIVTTRAL